MANTPSDPKRGQGQPLSAPWVQSTYSRIIQSAIYLAKKPASRPPPLEKATARRTAARVAQRRRVLAIAGAGAFAIALVFATGGVAFWVGASAPTGRDKPDRNELRTTVRARLDAGDYVGAKDALAALRQSGRLGDADRLELVAAVDAGMVKLRSELQRKVDEHRSAGRYDAALATLDEMERAGFSGEGMLFSRAELLRQGGRGIQARPFYERYATLYPRSERADDALFWTAEALARAGDKAGARRVLDRLLGDYPATNVKAAAKKLLAESR